MRRPFSFTKDKTEMIKGIAIILMLFHHFFAFPEWFVTGVSYIGIPLRANTLEFVIGKFGHICVALFAFLTGYGLFFSYKSGSILKKTLRRGAIFLLGYFLILFGVAIPLNVALGKTSDLSVKFILMNMTAYNHDLVPFAWYVWFYVALIITLPFFYKIMSRHAFITFPIFILVPGVVNYFLAKVASTDFWVCTAVNYAMQYFLWVSCALAGLCFAKYKLFDIFEGVFERLGRLRLLCTALFLLILMYFRAYKSETVANYFTFDCLYAPIFIFLAIQIISAIPQIFGDFLKMMGKHSMNIWFLHSLFFFRTSEIMKVAYAPRVSILIIAWVILLCLPISAAMNYVSDFLTGLLPKKRTQKTASAESEENKEEKAFQKI